MWIAATAAHHRPPSGSVAAFEAHALNPLCFLTPDVAVRVDALVDAYHRRPFDRSQREALLRLILLHRYSHLKAQIAAPDWPAAPNFAAHASLV